MYAYRVDDPKLKEIGFTEEAQRDMVASFPPCQASQLDKKTCKEIEKYPNYNMTGIDWTADSKRIIVMAEIPCSGGHGGIMCQVKGYELEIPSGRIVRSMPARQFAREWQKSMAWKFSIPDPPDYCNPKNRQVVFGCADHDW